MNKLDSQKILNYTDNSLKLSIIYAVDLTRIEKHEG